MHFVTEVRSQLKKNTANNTDIFIPTMIYLKKENNDSLDAVYCVNLKDKLAKNT